MSTPLAGPPQFARGGRAGMPESPRFEHAVVGVALEGEEDATAAQVVVLLGWGAWVPAVARQLAVGGIEALAALAFVLADEEHEWRLVGVGDQRVAPPPAEEVS